MDDGILEGLTDASQGPRPLLWEWPLLCVLGFDWAFGLWLWRRLPAVVPSHWNLKLEPDGWGGPGMAAFALPALATGTGLLMLFFPRLGSGLAGTKRIAAQVRLLITGLLVAMHVTLYAPMALDPGKLKPGAQGLWAILALILVILGNLMPRMEIRSRHRDAWRRAMRLGGRALAIAGLLQLVFFWLPVLPHLLLVLATTAVAAVVPYGAAQQRIPRLPQEEVSVPDERWTPWLHGNDFLALAGATAAFLLAWRRPPASVLLVALPMVWGLLLAEARLRRGGEMRRARTALRGWIVFGLGLQIAAMALGEMFGVKGTPYGLAGSVLILAATGLGQKLVRNAAPESCRKVWEEGPTLWDPADPRVLAPKLIGWGWSLNFAHLASWVLMAAFIVPLILAA